MQPTPTSDEAGLVAHVLARTGAVNGDDAAVLRIGGGVLCVSTDSTIAGVHAPAATPPRALGRRAAARALSDLAAMGARPVAMTCALHVPADGWSAAAEALDGLQDRAAEQGAPLVGGDVARTTADVLAVVVTVIGRRAGSRAGRDPFASRRGMRPGDGLWVTGTLGACTAALARGDVELPEPPDRIRAGIALAPFAHAMLDLSDGVARDLCNLLTASPACGAVVDLDALPLVPGLEDPLQAAAGGDDYELLLALPEARVDAARAALQAACGELRLTQIGAATDDPGVVVATRAGIPLALPAGFLHH